MSEEERRPLLMRNAATGQRRAAVMTSGPQCNSAAAVEMVEFLVDALGPRETGYDERGDRFHKLAPR